MSTATTRLLAILAILCILLFLVASLSPPNKSGSSSQRRSSYNIFIIEADAGQQSIPSDDKKTVANSTEHQAVLTNRTSSSSNNNNMVLVQHEAMTPCENMTLAQCIYAADCKVAHDTGKCAHFVELLQRRSSDRGRFDQFEFAESPCVESSPLRRLGDARPASGSPDSTGDEELNRVNRFKRRTSWMFTSWFDWDAGGCAKNPLPPLEPQEATATAAAPATKNVQPRTTLLSPDNVAAGLAAQVQEEVEPQRTTMTTTAAMRKTAADNNSSSPAAATVATTAQPVWDPPAVSMRGFVPRAMDRYPYAFDNFCISPTAGLYGFEPRVDRIVTFDETGLLPDYLGRIFIKVSGKPLKQPPSCFHNTKVLFYPLQTHEAANNNLAHVTVRMATAFSLLRTLFFPDDDDNNNNGNNTISSAAKRRYDDVLLVFIAMEGRADARSGVRGALRLFLHALGVNWASITVPASANVPGKKPRDFQDGTSYPAAELPDSALCFRRGFVWQTTTPCADGCRGGSGSSAKKKKAGRRFSIPAYAFSWRGSDTPEHRAVLHLFRARLAVCYGIQPRPWARTENPNLVISHRSRFREIENISSAADHVIAIAQRRGFNRNSVLFLEPRRIAFGDVVRTCMYADVMFGLHSATLQLHILMPPGALLVQAAQLPFSEHCSDLVPVKRCIFATGRVMLNQEHIFFPFPDAFLRRNADIAVVPQSANVELPFELWDAMLERSRCVVTALREFNNRTEQQQQVEANQDAFISKSCPDTAARRAALLGILDADTERWPILTRHSAFLSKVFDRSRSGSSSHVAVRSRNPVWIFERNGNNSSNSNNTLNADDDTVVSLQSFVDCRRLPSHRFAQHLGVAGNSSDVRETAFLQRVLNPNYANSRDCRSVSVLSIFGVDSSRSDGSSTSTSNSSSQICASSPLSLHHGSDSHHADGTATKKDIHRPMFSFAEAEWVKNFQRGPQMRFWSELTQSYTRFSAHRLSSVTALPVDCSGNIDRHKFSLALRPELAVIELLIPSEAGHAGFSEHYVRSFEGILASAIAAPLYPKSQRDILVFASSGFLRAVKAVKDLAATASSQNSRLTVLEQFVNVAVGAVEQLRKSHVLVVDLDPAPTSTVETAGSSSGNSSGEELTATRATAAVSNNRPAAFPGTSIGAVKYWSCDETELRCVVHVEHTSK